MSHEREFAWESSLEAAFRAFHAANPQVYSAFKRFTHEALASGRSRFGVAMVWERLRWYTVIEMQSEDGLKLNNNHRAYYARMFMEDYPEYGEVFETRRVRG